MSVTARILLRRGALSLLHQSRCRSKPSLEAWWGVSVRQRRSASVLTERPAAVKPLKHHVNKISVYSNIGPTPKEDRSTKFLNPSTREGEAVRAMASWCSWDGKGIDPDQILQQLPIRISALHVDTAIFFVTSRFAHLLEPESNFLNAVMNRMCPATFSKEELPMKSIVAIVDAIPLVQKGHGQHNYVRSAEGISLCLTASPHFVLAGQNGLATAPVITFTTAFRSATGNLQKRLREGGQSVEKIHDAAFSYSGLPANTLFVNGQKHTLTLQHWDRVNADLVCRSEVGRLSHLNVPIYSHDTRDFTSVKLESNIQMLTKSAKIVSSMGNILREISDDEGKVTSASHELEIVVPPMVKTAQEKDANAELQVFALVYPDSERTRELSSRLDQATRAGSFGIQRLLLLEGARLHRVTSGGAGWGKKAGLLSLDPMIQLNQPPVQESAASFFPGFEIEDEVGETSTIKEKLLPEGHLVRFCATFRKQRVSSLQSTKSAQTPKDHGDGSLLGKAESGPQWEQTNYFTPSRLQRLTIGTTTKESIPKEEVETSKRTYFAPNSFGFLTASPVGVDVITPQEESVASDGIITGQSGPIPLTRVVHSTLVEIPNACFLAKAPNGGKRVDVPNKDIPMIHPEVAEIINSLATSETAVSKKDLELSVARQEKDQDSHLQPAEHAGFRTRYIERFFQKVTGESRPGDIERFNRAIKTSGIIRKLRGHSNKEAFLNRIIALTMGRRRNKKREKDLAELAGLTDMTDETSPDEPIMMKVRRVGLIRKVDQYDNRLQAQHTNYRARDSEAFREEVRKRAEEMAPSREKRYGTTKSVEGEANTGVFDRQRKQQKAEKAVVGSLLDDIAEDDRKSGSYDKKS